MRSKSFALRLLLMVGVALSVFLVPVPVKAQGPEPDDPFAPWCECGKKLLAPFGTADQCSAETGADILVVNNNGDEDAWSLVSPGIIPVEGDGNQSRKAEWRLFKPLGKEAFWGWACPLVNGMWVWASYLNPETKPARSTTTSSTTLPQLATPKATPTTASQSSFLSCTGQPLGGNLNGCFCSQGCNPGGEAVWVNAGSCNPCYPNGTAGQKVAVVATPIPTPKLPKANPELERLIEELDQAWAQEDWPRAIETLYDISQIAPEWDKNQDKWYAAYLAYGWQLLREGQLEEAREKFTWALFYRPNGIEAEEGLREVEKAEKMPPATAVIMTPTTTPAAPTVGPTVVSAAGTGKQPTPIPPVPNSVGSLDNSRFLIVLLLLGIAGVYVFLTSRGQIQPVYQPRPIQQPVRSRQPQRLKPSGGGLLGGLGQPMGGTKTKSYKSVADLPPRERRTGFVEIGELGRGGFSVVKRVEWPAYGLAAAIKIVTPTNPSGERAVSNEITALSKLRHPAIPRLYDSWQNSGSWKLLLELVEGEELLSLVPLREQKARSILRQVAGALRHAHQHGLVYADLKPENVLVNARGPKLVDWGAAVRLGRSPTIGLFTPGYAPEEQNPQNDKQAQPAWDWHALGVTFYVCLTGDNPATAGLSWQPNLQHARLSTRARRDIEALLQGWEVQL